MTRRRAYRAAAKILYCYLLLELGPPALTSPASETLRRLLMDDESALSSPRWEVTRPAHSPSPSWHVLMFDSVGSAAAVGLFGTIWFRFRLDLGALAPHGRLVAFDVKGARGLAVLRSRGGCATARPSAGGGGSERRRRGYCARSARRTTRLTLSTVNGFSS